MPIISVEEMGALPDFTRMAKTFPELAARILGFVGKSAGNELAAMMLQGEKGVTFRSMRSVSDHSSKRSGRDMLRYTIGKGAQYVRISSFPLNLFEGGRTLRSGNQEAGRNIIRGSLRSKMAGRMQNLINAAGKVIVSDWIESGAKP